MKRWTNEHGSPSSLDIPSTDPETASVVTSLTYGSGHRKMYCYDGIFIGDREPRKRWEIECNPWVFTDAPQLKVVGYSGPSASGFTAITTSSDYDTIWLAVHIATHHKYDYRVEEGVLAMQDAGCTVHLQADSLTLISPPHHYLTVIQHPNNSGLSIVLKRYSE